MDLPVTKNVHTRPVTPEEHTFYRTLIGQLVERRRKMGMSQSELNDRLGMSEAMVAKWESMARFPGAFFLMCWAKALGVKFIVEEEDQPI